MAAEPTIIRHWEQLPPVVIAEGEAVSTRLLEKQYRDLEEENKKLKRQAEQMRLLLEDVTDLCMQIVGAAPDTTIAGEIESKAFCLAHHPWVLNPHTFGECK